jgi:hypothetical protein
MPTDSSRNKVSFKSYTMNIDMNNVSGYLTKADDKITVGTPSAFAKPDQYSQRYVCSVPVENTSESEIANGLMTVEIYSGTQLLQTQSIPLNGMLAGEKAEKKVYYYPEDDTEAVPDNVKVTVNYANISTNGTSETTTEHAISYRNDYNEDVNKLTWVSDKPNGNFLDITFTYSGEPYAELYRIEATFYNESGNRITSTHDFPEYYVSSGDTFTVSVPMPTDSSRNKVSFKSYTMNIDMNNVSGYLTKADDKIAVGTPSAFSKPDQYSQRYVCSVPVENTSESEIANGLMTVEIYSGTQLLQTQSIPLNGMLAGEKAEKKVYYYPEDDVEAVPDNIICHIDYANISEEK